MTIPAGKARWEEIKTDLGVEDVDHMDAVLVDEGVSHVAAIVDNFDDPGVQVHVL